MTGLAGLFVAAFLAATPLPMQSEVVFLVLLANGTPIIPLIIVASVGNILGSCVTFAVGRGLGGARAAAWFPVAPDQMRRAESWFRRWGVWTLLISWAPGGDLAVAMAGAFRVPTVTFLALVTLAKTGRYCVVALIGAGIWG
jgi:membrane protein YqaA with SNARE-associated domain